MVMYEPVPGQKTCCMLNLVLCFPSALARTRVPSPVLSNTGTGELGSGSSCEYANIVAITISVTVSKLFIMVVIPTPAFSKGRLDCRQEGMENTESRFILRN